jgi:nitrite reductase/ring-hydroxylating ferredoxin subunit
MGRTLVVGDVHGCARELRALLAACAYAPGDEVVFVGDLVAKGPDSRGVLALYRELGARGTRGNHDAHVLRWLAAQDRGEPPPALGASHRAVAEALDDRDWATLRSLRLWLRLPAHDALVVHAGLVPGVPLDGQSPFDLMNVRTLGPDGRGSKRADAGPLWASAWRGPELVLFGHHARRGLQRHPHALGLDTGCVYGGELSACVLPEREVVSVPAARAYAPVGDSADASRPLARVRVVGVETLAARHASALPLPRAPGGPPRQAILVRDGAGVLHAYLNRCMHTPIPIDAGGGNFLSPDRTHLICRTHGATYRLEDGYCDHGPCVGKSLIRLPLREDAEGLFLEVGG